MWGERREVTNDWWRCPVISSREPRRTNKLISTWNTLHSIFEKSNFLVIHHWFGQFVKLTLSSINLYDSINIKYLVLHNPDIRHTRRDTGHRHWTVIESDMEEKEGEPKMQVSTFGPWWCLTEFNTISLSTEDTKTGDADICCWRGCFDRWNRNHPK